MADTANPDGQRVEGQVEEQGAYLNPTGGMVGKAFAAVPPEVQQMLNVKPGKTSARIHQVIAWAAAADPDVLRQHQQHDRDIRTVADIHAAPLREKDHVATHFAKQYRHRAALTGAITALPGGLWALVGMGADVQLTAIYAVRMAAKIAQSYGYNTTDVEEQAHLADVLALAAGVDSLRGIGNWVAREGLVQILPDVLPRVLARLSVELTADAAAKWVGRVIPGVSAAIGASVDYAFLRAAGERAIAYYHNRALDEAQGLLPSPSATHALPAPGVTASATASASAAPVVEGSIVDAAPAAIPAPQTLPPEPGNLEADQLAPQVAASIAAPAGAPATAPAAPEAPARSARRRRSHWGRNFAIFLVIAAIATIIACAALGTIIGNAIQPFLHQFGL